jgi:hypothetical protein
MVKGDGKGISHFGCYPDLNHAEFGRLSFWWAYGIGRGAPEWPGFTPPGGLKFDRPIHFSK